MNKKHTVLGGSLKAYSDLVPYCYSIMQAHGGSISVGFKGGSGSTFYMELPENS